MRRKKPEEKSPKVDSELWSYISCGDGLHCPSHSHCKPRQNGMWCLSDNIERMSELQIAEQISPQNYDFIRSGTICNIFKMVENLSKTYLDLGGIQCPPVPTDLVSLIDGQDIEIRTLSFKGCSGAVCFFDNKWIIYLNAKDPLASRRFSLFHEAFHVLAHSNTTPIFKKIGSAEGSFNECLADVFAGSLLAPNEWINKIWEDVHDVKETAKIFAVPESFMWIRLKRLGII
jgi:hypothetical protein